MAFYALTGQIFVFAQYRLCSREVLIFVGERPTGHGVFQHMERAS